MKLVIVESPTKSKTISAFLGKEYKVLASFGHVRDLPKRDLGVDVEHDFLPKYVIPAKAKKTISELKKAHKAATETILATDEDREGESISWHLQETLGLKNPKRIVFHEITKTAIEDALTHPRTIDMNLVNAQQARRVLDRIVGYKLSPFLWKKVAKGLSAGRVQSVAVRLVAEREEERKAFVPQEYWSIEAELQDKDQTFKAMLVKRDGKALDKLEIKNTQEADAILKDLEGAEYIVISVEKKETKRNPLPPFTTSTLQQAAWQKFRFTAKQTMQLAQRLYEEGRITYHRTDSLNLSAQSREGAKQFITRQFGEPYYAHRLFKAKRGAQEAHEAIRPTRPSDAPAANGGTTVLADKRQEKLYTLIWQRFMASQMAPAIFDSTSVEVNTKPKTLNTKQQRNTVYTFGATGQVLKFDGFLKVYPMKFQEADLPPLEKNEALELIKLEPSQHFTEPPARYNEASLIKALEKHGIGRPSTYAPTLTTIQDRQYVQKDDQKRFFPTEMGGMVNGILVENFPEVVDIDFTAHLEKELDHIEEGKETWQKACRDFYVPFEKNLKEKYREVPKENMDIPTDKVCPKCSKPMVEKMGRFGRFYACTGFPECRHTESLAAEKLNIKCPKCSTGQISPKRSKRGKTFYGCTNYPDCDFALWDKPTGEKCPTCGSLLVEKGKQIKCSSKTCDYKKSES